MWGVTWANVKLMMADSIRTHYDTDDNKSSKEEVYDLSTEAGFNKFKRNFND
jgi:hypothetical protein